MKSFLPALLIPVFGLAQGAELPRLEVDAVHFDFGQVPPDAEVTHLFKLRNAGGGFLRINRLVPTCGCTSALVGKDVLEPGEATEVSVVFRTAGMTGKVRKTIEVDTDAQGALQTYLSFEAEVARAVIPATELVVLADLTRRDRKKFSVKLASGTGKPIIVRDVKLSSAPWLGVATRPVGIDQYVDLDLLARSLPKDQLAGTDSITLFLDNPGPSVVNLAVHWELRPPVTIAPDRVAWAEPAGHTLNATLTLKHREHKAFRIVSARTSNPQLRVLDLPAGAAPTQVVRLQLDAEVAPGNYEEKVFLTLDTPGHPEMAVRVAAALD